MLEHVLEKIKKAWEQYPEVNIEIKEITRDSQAPNYNEVNKNDIIICIRRRKRGDMVSIVRRGLKGQFDLAVPFEQLGEETLAYIGVHPSEIGHYCSKCKEFTAYVRSGRMCDDCREEWKKKGLR